MLSMLMRIGADATGAQRVVAGLASVTNKAFSAVGKEITGRLVGAFAAGAVLDRVTGFAKDTVDYADNLGDMAENLGITIEEVQRLGVASTLAGVKFAKMQGVLDKITALQAQAIDGDKKAVGIFAALGLDPRQANALQIMEAAIGNQSVAADLFGKRLNNVANVMEKLRTLGPIKLITPEQAEQLGKANDQLDEAFRKLKVAATPGIASALRGGAFALEQMQKPGTGIPFSGFLSDVITERIKRLFGIRDAQQQSIAPISNAIPSKPGQPQVAQPSAIALAAQSDALGRIGLFVGGRASVGDQLVSIGNYQLSELRAVRQILQEANR